MSQHLQKFSKDMAGTPFKSAIPVSTDPAFIEKLAHFKRSNICYGNFAKNKGREDNLLYHISDGFNLNKREDETYMDKYLAI